jgi:hypothetical protein
MTPDDPNTAQHRWPFAPLQPDERAPAGLPGGNATDAQQQDEHRPKPPAKPVDPRPQAT